MGSFHLTKMSFRNLFKKPATKMYPVVAPSYTKRSKGHVVCDIKACIFCGICEKRCPTHAITVSKPDESWTIDNFSCIQCLSCVRNCPKTCLVMDPEYTKAALQKTAVTVKKPELTAEEKAAKEVADKEKAERIARAQATKAARDAEKAAQGANQPGDAQAAAGDDAQAAAGGDAQAAAGGDAQGANQPSDARDGAGGARDGARDGAGGAAQPQGAN